MRHRFSNRLFRGLFIYFIGTNLVRVSLNCPCVLLEEIPTNVFGESLQKQVEDRLKFYETGDLPSKNAEVMHEAVLKAEEAKKKILKKEKKKKKKKNRDMEVDGEVETNGEHIMVPV